eukprot:CAMPEP_0180116780 /NCGR_PEP_ID=MMETSP0986-20121125/559_1 /TAXON_ID=697907 /ORGANISM="non described non described, Strain CCMP2293" /LENGTH=67 /DNA_ID=CAMNT_0022055593 /DNA_START=644 /DNA_END=847 /DNA_ORIENTATION=+
MNEVGGWNSDLALFSHAGPMRVKTVKVKYGSRNPDTAPIVTSTAKRRKKVAAAWSSQEDQLQSRLRT